MKSFIIIVLTLMIIQENHAQDRIMFKHILITNDDGIEDKARLLKLAQSVNQVADRVSIVVPESDRSGTSNHTTFGKYQRTLEVYCLEQDEGNTIGLYTVPGNPADCILLGILGLFGEDKPDLVLSGINSGANIGPEWFGSGTIGAVRMASFLGVKGIAFSGYYKKDPEYCDLIRKWIIRFISGGITGRIGHNDYLTVAFPDVSPDKIKGVKVARRRVSYGNPDAVVFKKTEGDEAGIPGNRTVWSLTIAGNPVSDPEVYDDILLKDGYVLITPMTIDENDSTGISQLQGNTFEIPDFPSE